MIHAQQIWVSVYVYVYMCVCVRACMCVNPSICSRIAGKLLFRSQTNIYSGIGHGPGIHIKAIFGNCNYISHKSHMG